jgi:hypothetical protein
LKVWLEFTGADGTGLGGANVPGAEPAGRAGDGPLELGDSVIVVRDDVAPQGRLLEIGPTGCG